MRVGLSMLPKRERLDGVDHVAELVAPRAAQVAVGADATFTYQPRQRRYDADEIRVERSARVSAR